MELGRQFKDHIHLYLAFAASGA
jgi:hypothetical protein